MGSDFGRGVIKFRWDQWTHKMERQQKNAQNAGLAPIRLERRGKMNDSEARFTIFCQIEYLKSKGITTGTKKDFCNLGIPDSQIKRVLRRIEVEVNECKKHKKTL